jgi:hypothetical protein
MANNWSAGLANPNAVQKLIYKYQHPKKAFNADPTGQQAAYAAGVTRAINANKYAHGMATADLNAAATNMVNQGGTNWSNAGQAKKYKYARKTASLAAAINATMATVEAMPKGRGTNNRARMMAWFDTMSSYYGKITAA